MASFVLSRARRLFSYSDLQGTSVDAMETGAGGSGSTSDHSGGGAAGLIPERLRSRKKCIGISTGIFATVVLFCIIASVHQSDDISLRTLPAAFSSASSGSGVGSVSDARRVKMSDTSQGKFYASHWNGTWINDEEFLFRDSEEGLQIYNVRADNFTQIMSPNKMNFFRPYEVKLSADKRYLLMKKIVPPSF